MSCLNIHPPTYRGWDWKSTFGWYAETVRENDNASDKKQCRYVNYNTLANILSYVLSPIIGIIRIIVNAYFLAKDKDVKGHGWDAEEKSYLRAQIGRGVAELFGAGYILWIPDLIKTIHRKYTED